MEILFLSLLITFLCYGLFCLYNLIHEIRGQSCYLLAYECFKPPEDTKLDRDTCVRIIRRNKNLGLQEYKFLLKAMAKSGIGEHTYAPRSVIEGREECATIEDSLKEVDEIMFETLERIFKRTGFSPVQIDILVVNITVFSSVSSFAARIINRYKLRDDIKVFNLSGTGCSGSIVAIDLVHRLLKTMHKNCLAVVVSTECLSQSWYCGKVTSMMLSNCLFRSGGGCLLLTNNPSLKPNAILRLKHVERTHLGASDEAYGSAMMVEDEQGHQGIYLKKSVPKAASEALKVNLKIMVPKILPLWEIVCYFTVSIYHSTMKRGNNNKGLNFKSGIEHFCVHPGGRAVIDEISKGLGLNDYDIEPSRMTIHRWGNTSSSGVWYVLSYMEAKKRLKKGDRVLMIGLGSGFKCCSCVWEVMRDLEGNVGNNVWMDCIDNYPPNKLGTIFVNDDQILASIKSG
ncbi:3-ketoacyl-CoA synthase 19-like [Arachis stenosperma]|uniref:3-ketoacyl-CoA synthase 19-like n=1 Tax=Arachis stenosperma TaxID=217475 RepID=UPI0025AD1262|nr:3-ketoacyl-CoA synthase 19-like [Arachis stenosperma]